MLLSFLINFIYKILVRQSNSENQKRVTVIICKRMEYFWFTGHFTDFIEMIMCTSCRPFILKFRGKKHKHACRPVDVADLILIQIYYI